MSEPAFDLAAFYAHVQATQKERSALRQDLVRGLKDYFEATYGYDRYGAETIFQISDRMAQPYIYGYALTRILHDRRLSDAVKIRAATHALDLIAYGQEGGLPRNLLGISHFLWEHERIDDVDLRYCLVSTAGETDPFADMQKADMIDFVRRILQVDEMSTGERMFWGHSLIARHRDGSGAPELINLVMSQLIFSQEDRRELCRAWINFRQPQIDVHAPSVTGGFRATFAAEHMPFWVAHAPSWSSYTMVRLGIVWLARLGEDPLQLGEKFMSYKDMYAEHVHAGVADIIAEHHDTMPPVGLRNLIEKGIAISGSISTRRRFYRLGTDLFGPDYLERATTDTANSVRQWATRQLQKQT